jgi:hypothetical protein
VSLTLRQEQAALLMSLEEMTDSDISTILGLHHKTVGKWRRGDDEFRERVEAHKRNQIANLEPMIQQIRMQFMVVLDKAVKTLSAALDERDIDGRPTRKALDAVGEALKHAKLVAPSGITEGEADSGPSYAVIQVNLPEGKEAPKQIESTATEG